MAKIMSVLDKGTIRRNTLGYLFSMFMTRVLVKILIQDLKEPDNRFSEIYNVLTDDSWHQCDQLT